MTGGTVDPTGSTPTISGDSDKLNRISPESRLNGARSMNGCRCEAGSSGIFVSAIKAIDS